MRSAVISLSLYADDYDRNVPCAAESLWQQNYSWGGFCTSTIIWGQALWVTICCSVPCIGALMTVGIPVTESRGLPELGVRGAYAPDSYYNLSRTLMSSRIATHAPLGGDSIHTRDVYQANYIITRAPSDINPRGLGIGGIRTLHMRHSGRANVFYVDGHTSSLSASQVTPETWSTYALVTN